MVVCDEQQHRSPSTILCSDRESVTAVHDSFSSRGPGDDLMRTSIKEMGRVLCVRWK